MNNKKIAFIGGDSRQVSAALDFARLGYEVVMFGFDKYPDIKEPLYMGLTLGGTIRDAFAVILPLPSFSDPRRLNAPLAGDIVFRADLLDLLEPEQQVFGAMLDKDFIDAHANCVDYYDSEELKILNAIPTAEGAIAIAMEELPITLHGSNAVVLGYGRIGKMLAHMLHALGANVAVCARKESDLAYCEAYGYRPMNIKSVKHAVSNADLVINTIPERILADENLSVVSKSTLVIDLAKHPGGVDFDEARNLGINAIWALSLPGKVAPVTAGRIIFRIIHNCLADGDAL